MMRLVAALIFLLLAGSEGFSRTRVVVQKPPPFDLRTNPYAFQAALEIGLCWHVAMSVPPEVPDGHYRLGKCPHRSKWPGYTGRQI